MRLCEEDGRFHVGQLRRSLAGYATTRSRLRRELGDSQLRVVMCRRDLNAVRVQRNTARAGGQVEGMKCFVLRLVPENQLSLSAAERGDDKAVRMVVQSPNPLVRRAF